MKSRWLLFLACVLLGAADAPPAVTRLRPLPLHGGINHVRRLTPDGRAGIITWAWHEWPTAHSYGIYTVMVNPPGPGRPRWQVVAVERPDSEKGYSDQITYDPHGGEATIGAARFARGLVAGRPAVLLLEARRSLDTAKSWYDPATTTYDVYVLQTGESGIGPTPSYFKRILHRNLPDRYCEAEIALSRVSGLPLPPHSVYKRTPTGC